MNRNRNSVEYHKEWAKVRKETIKRDRSTCQVCGYGVRDKNRDAQVHHKDGDWTNNDPENLETLCWDCHKEVHRLKMPAILRALRLFDDE